MVTQNNKLLNFKPTKDQKSAAHYHLRSNCTFRLKKRFGKTSSAMNVQLTVKETEVLLNENFRAADHNGMPETSRLTSKNFF